MTGPPADWPFPDDPPNVAVITTRGILDGTDWIARASLDADEGDWQFHAAAAPREEDAKIVALRRIYELDPSIAELADLPLGWQAWRTDRHSPWQRAPRD